jgi:hypothetical protein
MQKIISMLGDPQEHVRRSARRTVAALLQYGEFFPSAILMGSDSQQDDLRAAISTSETMKKIIPMLENPYLAYSYLGLELVETVAALLQYGEFFPLRNSDRK